jgi:flagellar motor component MotA
MSSRAAAFIKDEEMPKLRGLDRKAIEAAMARLLSAYEKLVGSGDISEANAEPHDDINQTEPIRIIQDTGGGDLELEELTQLFLDVAEKAEAYGLLSLESDIRKIKDPIIRKGFELIIDGTHPEIVESILRNTLDKELRFMQMKYEAVIEAVLGIQQGDAPRTVLQVMESRLP